MDYTEAEFRIDDAASGDNPEEIPKWCIDYIEHLQDQVERANRIRVQVEFNGPPWGRVVENVVLFHIPHLGEEIAHTDENGMKCVGIVTSIRHTSTDVDPGWFNEITVSIVCEAPEVT